MSMRSTSRRIGEMGEQVATVRLGQGSEAKPGGLEGRCWWHHRVDHSLAGAVCGLPAAPRRASHRPEAPRVAAYRVPIAGPRLRSASMGARPRDDAPRSLRPLIATHHLGDLEERERGAEPAVVGAVRRASSLCAMRILAACSLGGAGHFNPLVPFLRAALRRGDEVLAVGPPALREMVESAGFRFRAGGEPSEEQVAAIRERLPVVPAAEASVLGNRELFGRLATEAMLTGMEDAWGDWDPDLVLRDPTEYASAILAARTRTPTAQVAISLAQAEAGSIATAAPALELHRQGLIAELRARPT